MLRLDLKDLTPRPSTPVFSHLGLASVTAGALLLTYALINAPSASTTEAPGINTPEITGREITGHAPRAESPETESTESIVVAGLGPPGAQPTGSRGEFTGHDDSPTTPDAATTQTRPQAPDASPKPAAGNDGVNFAWTTATVKRQDTLSRIFKRHGVKVKDAYAAVKLEDAALLGKIRPGDEIQLAADGSGALAALRYRLNALSTLHIAREDGRLRAEVITRTPEIRLRDEKAIIWSSLLDAAKDTGIDFETVYDLAQLFSWQVDFAREIKSGDQFTVIFEELYLDNEKVGNGDIFAAELIISNRRLRAVRHVDAHGRSTYYAPNGDGIQRSFLRSPLKFGRVTSRFSHKRFHPIFKQWRAHRGVDYGAPKGTPVRSTGDGVVTLAGRNHGYGNTIMIRHGGKYTTLYAHLSRLAGRMKSGVRVRQGEVIGYVGDTGWATGAHLHYEFRVNGIHRNPLTAKLPKSDPIGHEHQQEFLARAAEWVARLDQISAIPVAQIDAAQ